MYRRRSTRKTPSKNKQKANSRKGTRTKKTSKRVPLWVKNAIDNNKLPSQVRKPGQGHFNADGSRRKKGTRKPTDWIRFSSQYRPMVMKENNWTFPDDMKEIQSLLSLMWHGEEGEAWKKKHSKNA